MADVGSCETEDVVWNGRREVFGLGVSSLKYGLQVVCTRVEVLRVSDLVG